MPRQRTIIDLRGAKPDDATVLSELVRSLEGDILYGRLRPRERLVEDSLMQRFDAKRHVVRQALAALEHMGVVVRNPNRGASVRDFSAEEVEEISELRETLHRGAVQRMHLPASAEVINELKALQRRHDKAIAEKCPRRIDAANEAFHERLFRACANRHLSDAIAHYAYVSRAMRLYPMVDTELLAVLRDEHWAMIEALRKGDRKTLLRLVANHIQHSKGFYLAARQRSDDANEPSASC